MATSKTNPLKYQIWYWPQATAEGHSAEWYLFDSTDEPKEALLLESKAAQHGKTLVTRRADLVVREKKEPWE